MIRAKSTSLLIEITPQPEFHSCPRLLPRTGVKFWIRTRVASS